MGIVTCTVELPSDADAVGDTDIETLESLDVASLHQSRISMTSPLDRPSGSCTMLPLFLEITPGNWSSGLPLTQAAPGD